MVLGERRAQDLEELPVSPKGDDLTGNAMSRVRRLSDDQAAVKGGSCASLRNLLPYLQSGRGVS